jgi:branched-chain amino acid aminotransferase
MHSRVFDVVELDLAGTHGMTAPAPPAFGHVFTDHMAVITYADGRWDEPRVVTHEPISLAPAASGLHYGQAIFEGLKAYRQPDGDIAFFRIRDHARRFQASAAHMAMPPLPVDHFVDACTALVTTDETFVPSEPGHSLYLRPLMLATTPRLGVQPATDYLCVIIASPVGAYLGSGTRAWTVKVERAHVRAAPGGTGAAKCAGNYGASLAARAHASSSSATADYDELLFLDATEHRWVEELSAMNLFVVEERSGAAPTLVTPPTGTILAGVTRASLLELAVTLGYGVREAPIAIDDWRRRAATGELTEAFASGTGAVVAPIGEVIDGDITWTIGDGNPGVVTRRLRAALLDLQEGRAPDRYGWRVPVRLRQELARMRAPAAPALHGGGMQSTNL